MDNSNVPPLPSSPNGNHTSLIDNFPSRSSTPPKHCWVCFATDEDDFSACWVSPCRCRGTAKWVHQECLQRWVDEKLQGSSGGSLFLRSFLIILLSWFCSVQVKLHVRNATQNTLLYIQNKV